MQKSRISDNAIPFYNSMILLLICMFARWLPRKATENVRAPRRLSEEMLRKRLCENSQISSKDDLLNSLNERSERSKATKRWSDTLIKGLLTMTAFGRGANEQDFPLQLAAVVKAVPVTATLFGRGWMTELPSTVFWSLFIHYIESLLTKAWKSLIITTVVFVSSLGSTTPF